MIADKKKRHYLNQRFFILILAATCIIILLYVYNLIRWANAPDFGFGLRTATGINMVGVLEKPAQKAGLKVGDRLIAANGVTVSSYLDLQYARNWKIGEENAYLVDRNGQQITINIPNVRLGFKKVTIRSGFTCLLGLCYIAIGILVYLMKPSFRTSWIFYCFAVVFGLFLTFLYKSGYLKPLWLHNLAIFSYTFTPASFIHLALSFPEERRVLKKYPLIQFVPYLASAFLFLGIRYNAPTMFDAPKLWLLLNVAYMAISVLYFIGSSIQLRFMSKSEIVKRRARMILLGFAIAASIPLIDFVINTIFKVYLVPNFNYYLPFFVVFPAFVGYSIVKHDLFDIDAIIKRTYGYVLTTGTIAGIYGLVVLFSNLVFGGMGFAKHPLFPLIFILLVIFLFNPVRNRVQKFIDRVFYRLEYDYHETVAKISETMRSLLNLDDIGKNIMKFALEPMFVDTGSVILLDKEKKEYDCLIQSGEAEQRKDSKEEIVSSEKRYDPERKPEVENRSLSIDEPFMKKMAEWKKTVTVYDIWEDPFFDTDRYECIKTFDQLGATLVVPLIYEDQLIGVISLGRKKSGKFYRREDINLLNILANQGSVAIENAMMVEEVIEKERMEEELNIARDLQVSMLPSETPQVKGFDIAAYSVAAREVGGDFYDFIDMGEDKAGMLIGDVTGKSVSGALVMSASRSVFRMLSEEERTVKDNMMRANRRIKKDVKTGMFVALLYAVLDAKNRSLIMCSAGQTQPVYWSAKTGEAILVETKGDTFPLGILDDAEYEETQLQLESDDKVILYTDGIVEAMNDQEELFGFERLQKLVQSSHASDAESLLKEILDTVNEFAGQAEQHDDLTAIVITVN